jgi:hypothetical protein
MISLIAQVTSNLTINVSISCIFQGNNLNLISFCFGVYFKIMPRSGMPTWKSKLHYIICFKTRISITAPTMGFVIAFLQTQGRESRGYRCFSEWFV